MIHPRAVTNVVRFTIVILIFLFVPASFAQSKLNTHYDTDGARVVVNFPAFRLYLYHGNELIKSYPVGVGMNDFKPIFGEMLAKEIVYNPSWSPTGSAWSRGHKATGPNAPGNPLGKVKLPLYGLYLIHGGAAASNLGHAVSHGCVRMLNRDAVDLMERILEIQNGDKGIASAHRGEHIRGRSVPIKLDKPVVVDFRYDTVAIDGDKVRIYPDIYHFNVDSQQALESALTNTGTSWDSLSEKKQQQILAAIKRSSRQSQTVALSDTQSIPANKNKRGLYATSH
ncbi:MAG TPA: L,D-transpeptidase [Blastocatellia bacterium]|nr:L,D-transpeptidase [Blastocatellia bacterium]